MVQIKRQTYKTLVKTRLFIPGMGFLFPGIGNGKMSFPGMLGILGMQR